MKKKRLVMFEEKQKLTVNEELKIREIYRAVSVSPTRVYWETVHWLTTGCVWSRGNRQKVRRLLANWCTTLNRSTFALVPTLSLSQSSMRRRNTPGFSFFFFLKICYEDVIISTLHTKCVCVRDQYMHYTPPTVLCIQMVSVCDDVRTQR